MRNLFSFILLAGLLYFAWPIVSQQESAEDLKADFDQSKNRQELSSALDKVNEGIHFFISQLDSIKEQLNDEGKAELPKIEKPELEAPDEKSFSIHNIEIGEPQAEVEKQLGKPERRTVNDYGSEWHTYHQNYQNFVMVSFDENHNVNGLYTNQDLISSKNGIKFGTKMEDVRKQLGEPLKAIVKGNVHYQLPKDREFDVYQLNDSYVTFFYNKHNNHKITAVQFVSEKMEQDKSGFYTNSSEALMTGFEYQLFDLTNASRVNHGLPVLKWDDQVTVTARKHSQDMASNQYFSHTNRQGESPFDRMEEDKIFFQVAGENLAYGQFSSIFAHEGLMNSLGHRENILKPEYELLGVGVAFGAEAQPYFTENFYTKKS